MANTNGIQAHWSILVDGTRTATVGDVLGVKVDRPVKGEDLGWRIVDLATGVIVHEGFTSYSRSWNRTPDRDRYDSQVRQAMFDVEIVARTMVQAIVEATDGEEDVTSVLCTICAKPLADAEGSHVRGCPQQALADDYEREAAKVDEAKARLADQRDEAIALAALALEQYLTFQATLAELGRVVRVVDPFEHSRFDAYPGWSADRDQGSRQSMTDWIEEVGQAIEQAQEAQTDSDDTGPVCDWCGEAGIAPVVDGLHADCATDPARTRVGGEAIAMDPGDIFDTMTGGAL